MDLIQMKKPVIVLLIETMCNNERVKSVRAKMNYEGLFIIVGPGHGGGFGLFWKRECNIVIKAFLYNYIDTEV